jgi:hypothetical protein
MTGLSITIQIDLGADLDEAKLAAILDGVRSLQTRLQLADRSPAPVAAAQAAEPTPAPADPARPSQAVRLVAAGLSHHEIADRLGCTRNAVWQRLSSAREKLRAPEGPPRCKSPGCTAPSATITGPYGRLCETHKAEKQRHRVSQPAPPAVRNVSAGGPVWCEYCQANRTQLHVEQHAIEVDREKARQDEERAKVAHLSRPTGVGGAA